MRATSCTAARAQAWRKRWGEDRRSLFSVHFIGITFISLQKNLAHTLGRRPLEGSSVKQATVRGWGVAPPGSGGAGAPLGSRGAGEGVPTEDATPREECLLEQRYRR